MIRDIHTPHAGRLLLPREFLPNQPGTSDEPKGNSLMAKKSNRLFNGKKLWFCSYTIKGVLSLRAKTKELALAEMEDSLKEVKAELENMALEVTTATLHADTIE
jgi:hypothetical protein